MWVATLTGLMRFAGGVWTRIGAQDGFDGHSASSVRLARDGRLWASSERGLFVRERGAARFGPSGVVVGGGGLRDSPDGSLWYAADAGVTRLATEGAPALARADFRVNASAPSIFDHQGNFWTRECAQGLCVIHAAALAGMATFVPAALEADTHAERPRRKVKSHVIFEDGANNIWVASSLGLARYRPNRVHAQFMDEQYDYFRLAQDGPDRFWLLVRPATDLWHYDGRMGAVASNTAYDYMQRGSAREALFIGHGGIERRRDGSIAAEPLRDGDGVPAPPIAAVNATFDGEYYWARTPQGRLWRLAGGRWESAQAFGLPAGLDRVAGASEGHSWFYGKGGGLAHFHAGVWRSYGAADGVDVGAINVVDPKDQVIVFGNAGVAVLVGTRFFRLNMTAPAAMANATATVRSANGDRWFNAPAGLVHVRRADWDAFLAHPGRRVESELFDAADGYPGAMMAQPSQMVTSHGGTRVWFVGKDGLAWIDSAAIARNAAAPPVEVVRLTAGARRYVGDQLPALAAGSRSVSIDYTALNYVAPERVRFKYQLDGVDRDWQDAGARRTAYYTSLRPGDYEFKVMAANEDGVWSVAPARMRFSIAPLFVETRLFLGLCVLAGASLLALAYWLRIKAVRRHVSERLHERLFERERIARSLHDTYLQSVQGLVLMFQGVVLRMPPADAPQSASLDAALARADAVLKEGRSQVLGLRLAAPPQEQLEHVFRDVAHAVFAAGATRFSVVSRGAGRPLRDDVRDEVYYIGREALLNAARHAGAGEVTMELDYGVDAFGMRVADNGVGLAPAIAARPGQAGGRWGITGMRERAAALRGTLEVRNRAGAGAEVSMTLPALIAYRDYRPALLARWWRRLRA